MSFYGFPLMIMKALSIQLFGGERQSPVLPLRYVLIQVKDHSHKRRFILKACVLLLAGSPIWTMISHSQLLILEFKIPRIVPLLKVNKCL